MSKTCKAVICIMVMVFIAGLCVFFYPTARGLVLDWRVSENAKSFLELVAPQEKQDTSDSPEQPTVPEEALEYPELWDAVNAYNRDIWQQRQSDLTDPWAYQQPVFALDNFGLEDEVFAVISIPEIELEMPIYLGASPDHLALGAAHLSQTSLPVGGENTNCVLAGHRGWHNGKYFCDIVALKPGDEVLITNMWGALRYQVCETRLIESYEIDKIKIQNGRDMLTLLTCYYNSDGHKMRFACYCERIYG